MLQQQRGEIPELADGKVGGVGGLRALLTPYPDAHVGRLDHTDVVGAC